MVHVMHGRLSDGRHKAGRTGTNADGRGGMDGHTDREQNSRTDENETRRARVSIAPEVPCVPHHFSCLEVCMCVCAPVCAPVCVFCVVS